MACVDSRGQLTTSARNILLAIEKEALKPEGIAQQSGLPLFKVRSSLRDMKSMGFVKEEGGTYSMSGGAKKLLDKQR